MQHAYLLQKEVNTITEGKKASDKRIIEAGKLIKNKSEQLDVNHWYL